MKLYQAEKAGFCYGVKRALSLVEKKLREKENRDIFILGPLIHNNQVNQKLAKQGLKTVQSIENVEEGILVIPSHGVAASIVKKAKEKGIEVCDATCPYVKKAQELAAKLLAEGYQVLVLGEANHSEVKGIVGQANGQALVVETEEELQQIELTNKVGLIVQTTQTKKKLSFFAGLLATRTKELKIYNTICQATEERQAAAVQLAGNVDLMLVLGGYQSANTKRLAEICREVGVADVYQVESAEEIESKWLQGKEKIGITAGASTPDWIIEEVKKKISQQEEE